MSGASTTAKPLRDLAWWAAEAERAGADWRGILLQVLRGLNVIEPCPVCECQPGPTPSFCDLCREADGRLRRPQRGRAA
jgi:hypothetical protein